MESFNIDEEACVNQTGEEYPAGPITTPPIWVKQIRLVPINGIKEMSGIG